MNSLLKICFKQGIAVAVGALLALQSMSVKSGHMLYASDYTTTFVNMNSIELYFAWAISTIFMAIIAAFVGAVAMALFYFATKSAVWIAKSICLKAGLKVEKPAHSC